MGSINLNLRGIRLKIGIFGTPKSGKYSFLQSMCKVTSTQGNLQLFSDDNGDVFSFVPIIKSVYSENINLQVKIMSARDKKGDGIVWQSIFKDIDGLIFLCRARKEYITQITEFLHKMQEFITHFGPREYSVPVAIFYNKFESDISIEELNKKVNVSNLKFFSGDLSDILPFISAVRFVVKESLKKHQVDYEKIGGKRNIEDAFEIVEVFRPAGVQIAESSVIINPPIEEDDKMPSISTPKAEDKSVGTLKEEDIEELSELVEERQPSSDSTVRIKTPIIDFVSIFEKGDLVQKMVGEIEQASQFFTLKISDLKREYISFQQFFEQIQSAYNSLKEENQNLSEKLTKMKSAYEEIVKKGSDVETIRAKYEDTKRTLEENNKKIEEMNQKISSLERDLIEKERLIQDKESLLAIKVTEVDELKARLKHSDTEKEKLSIERRGLTDKLTVLESKFKAVEEEKNRLLEENSKIQEEMLACRAEAEELQTNLGIKERELGELKKSSEEEINKLKTEVAALRAELADKSVPSNDEEIRRLSSELVNLQIELAQRDDRIKELEESLANKIKELEELKSLKSPKPSTTSETITPQMLAKTIISNLKLRYWDDMIASLKDGTFQKKYNPVFMELKKAYDSKIPENVENRDVFFQAELKALLEELKKNII
ncbi:MAG: hypothetical protein N2746_11860 [Deltaproteobacteria bacterium]|nr:hypothetical protein [Deltaproteobacteria bacterium]